MREYDLSFTLQLTISASSTILFFFRPSTKRLLSLEAKDISFSSGCWRGLSGSRSASLLENLLVLSCVSSLSASNLPFAYCCRFLLAMTRLWVVLFMFKICESTFVHHNLFFHGNTKEFVTRLWIWWQSIIFWTPTKWISAVQIMDTSFYTFH